MTNSDEFKFVAKRLGCDPDLTKFNVKLGEIAKARVPQGKKRAMKNVLFLCTGNSARSIIAEAILARFGKGKFAAYSAGSQPKGQLHPGTIRLLEGKGYDVSGMRSKSWDEFTGPDRIAFDHIITVCNNAAGEACPIIPGKPLKDHWDIPDLPAAGDVQRAFEEAYALLARHIEKFMVQVQ